MTLIRGFLGAVPHKNREIHIAGAGISGLLMAWHLLQQGYHVKIFEKSLKTGGLIESQNRKFGLTEAAANGILWSSHMQALCDSLNIQPIQANPQAATRYIVRNSKFHRFPLSFAETMNLIPRIFKSFTLQQEMSVDAWGRIVGGNELTDYILQPALYGIYAAEAEYLGAEAIFPKIFQKMRMGKSLVSAAISSRSKPAGNFPKGLHSFPDGMSTLVNALTEKMSEHIFTGQEIPYTDSDRHVIFTHPAWADFQGHISEELKGLLLQIEYAPLVSLTLFFRVSDIPALPKGFGCVIPSAEKCSVLGILFNHQIFENRVNSSDVISLTCIAGGYGRPDLVHQPQETIISNILGDLWKLLKFRAEPLDRACHVYSRALPVYSPGLPDIWKKAHQLLLQSRQPVSLFGNYTGEISIRGMCEVSARVSMNHVYAE